MIILAFRLGVRGLETLFVTSDEGFLPVLGVISTG